MGTVNKDPLNCIQYPLLKSSPALKSPVPAGACQPTTNTNYFTTGWYAPANVLPGWGMDETCNKPGSPGTSDSCFSGLAGNPSTGGGAVNNDPNNCLSDKMIKGFPGLKVPSGVCEKDLSGTFASGWFAPAYKTGTPMNQACNSPNTLGTSMDCFDPAALNKVVTAGPTGPVRQLDKIPLPGPVNAPAGGGPAGGPIPPFFGSSSTMGTGGMMGRGVMGGLPPPPPMTEPTRPIQPPPKPTLSPNPPTPPTPPTLPPTLPTSPPKPRRQLIPPPVKSSISSRLGNRSGSRSGVDMDGSKSGFGSSKSGFDSDGNNILLLGITSSGATSNTFGNTSVYFTNYASTTQNKSVSIDQVSENNATASATMLSAGLFPANTAITSVTVETFSTGNFVQYSTAYLYGISNA